MSHSEAPVLLVERRGGHSTHSPRLELRKVPMPQSVCMLGWRRVYMYVSIVPMCVHVTLSLSPFPTYWKD